MLLTDHVVPPHIHTPVFSHPCRAWADHWPISLINKRLTFPGFQWPIFMNIRVTSGATGRTLYQRKQRQGTVPGWSPTAGPQGSPFLPRMRHFELRLVHLAMCSVKYSWSFISIMSSLKRSPEFSLKIYGCFPQYTFFCHYSERKQSLPPKKT